MLTVGVRAREEDKEEHAAPQQNLHKLADRFRYPGLDGHYLDN